MGILIISCSRHPGSKSRILAGAADRFVRDKGAESELVDMREVEMPLCDGHSTYEHPSVSEMGERITNASAVILATPIYNYDANAIAKNLVEHTGRAWEDKVVAFLCAAGGQSSYMSIMGLANSLMLDFRCLIVPRFVYASGQAFQHGEIKDREIERRLERLVGETIALAEFRKG